MSCLRSKKRINSRLTTTAGGRIEVLDRLRQTPEMYVWICMCESISEKYINARDMYSPLARTLYSYQYCKQAHRRTHRSKQKDTHKETDQRLSPSLPFSLSLALSLSLSLYTRTYTYVYIHIHIYTHPSLSIYTDLEFKVPRGEQGGGKVEDAAVRSGGEAVNGPAPLRVREDPMQPAGHTYTGSKCQKRPNAEEKAT
jgi:hypothetical protein